jgi:hypothetical protein
LNQEYIKDTFCQEENESVKVISKHCTFKSSIWVGNAALREEVSTGKPRENA